MRPIHAWISFLILLSTTTAAATTRCEWLMKTGEFFHSHPSNTEAAKAPQKVQTFLSKIKNSRRRERFHSTLLVDSYDATRSTQKVTALEEHLKAVAISLSLQPLDPKDPDAPRIYSVNGGDLPTFLSMVNRISLDDRDGYEAPIQPGYGEEFEKFSALIDRDHEAVAVEKKLLGGMLPSEFSDALPIDLVLELNRSEVSTDYWAFFTITDVIDRQNYLRPRERRQLRRFGEPARAKTAAAQTQPSPTQLTRFRQWPAKLRGLFKKPKKEDDASTATPGPAPVEDRIQVAWDFLYIRAHSDIRQSRLFIIQRPSPYIHDEGLNDVVDYDDDTPVVGP